MRGPAAPSEPSPKLTAPCARQPCRVACANARTAQAESESISTGSSCNEPLSDASAFRAASAVWGAAPPALVFDSSLPGPIHERDCTTPPGSVPPRSVRCALVDSPSSRRAPACSARQRTTTVRARPGACTSSGMVTLASSAPSTPVSKTPVKGSDGSAATQVAASIARRHWQHRPIAPADEGCRSSLHSRTARVSMTPRLRPCGSRSTDRNTNRRSPSIPRR